MGSQASSIGIARSWRQGTFSFTRSPIDQVGPDGYGSNYSCGGEFICRRGCEAAASERASVVRLPGLPASLIETMERARRHDPTVQIIGVRGADLDVSDRSQVVSAGGQAERSDSGAALAHHTESPFSVPRAAFASRRAPAGCLGVRPRQDEVEEAGASRGEERLQRALTRLQFSEFAVSSLCGLSATVTTHCAVVMNTCSACAHIQVTTTEVFNRRGC